MKFLRCRSLGSLILAAIAASSLAQLPADVSKEQRRCMGALQSGVPRIRFYQEAERISRVYGVPFAWGASPIGSATTFMARYKGLFAGADGSFQISGSQDVMDGKFLAIYFKEFVGSIPVDRGNVTLLVRNVPNHPVVLAANGSQLVRQCSETPFFTSKQAQWTVQRLNRTLTKITAPTLTIWSGENGNCLAWTFEAGNTDLARPQKFRVFVDALTNQILEWRTMVCYVDVNGTTQGKSTPGLLPDQPNNPPVISNLAGLLVSISNGGSSYSDSNGSFTIPNSGTSAVNVNASLQGRWARVVDQAGHNLLFSQNVVPPGPVSVLFNNSPSSQSTAQVNGFIYTSMVHDYVRSINSTYPGVDIQMPVNVNIANSCDAYYDGSSINFFQAGGGCANTAFSTVIWHEYGHHLVQSAGTDQNGYGEGMGDVTASLLGDTPGVGQDLQGQGTGFVRSAYNAITYPSNAEIHIQGMILSGAFWLTLDQLSLTEGHAAGLTTLRRLWLNSILLRPTGISPQIAIDVLTLDDDDANLDNGTPHYSEIATGFNAKGLSVPNLTFLNVSPVKVPDFYLGPNDRSDDNIPTANFVLNVSNGIGTLVPNSVKLYSSVNGGAFQATAMASIGGGNYGATTIRPACGNSVRYYFEAKDTTNHIVRYPSDAPNGFNQFIVVDSYQYIFADTFESDAGWTVTNTDLTSGAWVRGDPNGTTLNGQQANPENDSDDVGAQCYFTGQGSVGGTPGEQDVDGGPTQLTSPTFSLAGANGVIEYSRWFFNDDGDDALTVELSNDGGTTWVTAEAVTYKGIQPGWVRKKLIVGNYVTPSANMRIRFSTSDNPNNSITEAGIDNVVITRINCSQ